MAEALFKKSPGHRVSDRETADIAENLRASGASEEQVAEFLAARLPDPADDTFTVPAELWETVQAFARLKFQMVLGYGVSLVTHIPRPDIIAVLDVMCVGGPDARREMFDGILIMEAVALRLLNNK